MPSRPMTVSGSVVVPVPPDRVYALISDPRRTPGYSPENTGAAPDGDGFAVGATFTGTNRRGRARWVTRCTVIRADEGECFAFRVHQIGFRTPRISAPIATWTYTLRPVAGGTEVTETWTDDRTRWPDLLARVFDAVATGGSTFATFQRRNIATTLRNLDRTLQT